MRKIYETFRTSPAALMVLLVGLLMLVAQAGIAQTVTTDKLDYAPGETVYITGTHFQPYEEILLTIVHIEPNMPEFDHEHVSTTVAADSSGYFEAEWFVNIQELNTTLLLMAEGDMGSYAETVFTDAQTKNLFSSATVSGISTICSGSTSSLGLSIATCTQSGNGDYSISYYKWQQSSNNTTWSDADGTNTNSTYVASPTSTTYYHCIITLSKKQDNCDGTNTTYTTQSFTLNVNNVNAGLIAKGATNPGPGCGTLDPNAAGTSASGSTDATGSGTISYQWEKSTDGSTWMRL